MNMKYLVGSLLAGAMMFGLSSQNWIEKPSLNRECGPHELHQFESIEKKLKGLETGSWLILDCTKTLVVPKDPVLKFGHWGKTLERALGRPPSQEELRRLKLLVELQAEKELVHPRWPSLLATLAERGVHILVLTKHPTGEQIAGLPSFEEIRSKHLKDLGFHFEKWAPKIDFEKLQMALPGREIGWFEGVMFAPAGDKGPILKALLETQTSLPTELLIVDDSFAQARSMADALRDYEIPSRVLLFRDESAQAPVVLTPEDERCLREFLSSGVWTR